MLLSWERSWKVAATTAKKEKAMFDKRGHAVAWPLSPSVILLLMTVLDWF